MYYEYVDSFLQPVSIFHQKCLAHRNNRSPQPKAARHRRLGCLKSFVVRLHYPSTWTFFDHSHLRRSHVSVDSYTAPFHRSHIRSTSLIETSLCVGLSPLNKGLQASKDHHVLKGRCYGLSLSQTKHQVYPVLFSSL